MKSASRDLVRYMVARGYTVDVDDGDDELPLIGSTSMVAIMDTAQSVDDCTLIFRKPDAKREAAYIVYGNDPDEEVADYTCDGVIDQWFESFYGERNE